MIPTTDKFVVRPVYHRYLRRQHAMIVGAPTEAEKRDAIRVLCDCYPPGVDVDDLLLLEAERIFTEGAVAEIERIREERKS